MRVQISFGSEDGIDPFDALVDVRQDVGIGGIFDDDGEVFDAGGYGGHGGYYEGEDGGLR